MSNNSKDRISPANILAIVGLAAVGVITFFGAYLKSEDGNPSGAIIWAVVVTAVLAGLLLLSVKAKGADNNPDKWRWVEYAALALFVVFGIAFSGSFVHFFKIIENKSELQQLAKTDIEEMKHAYSDYDNTTKSAWDRLYEDIKSAAAAGKTNIPGYVPLEKAEGLDSVSPTFKTWAEESNKLITLKRRDLTVLQDKVNAWNLLKLAGLANDVYTTKNEVGVDIHNKILGLKENQLIPVLTPAPNYAFGSYAELTEPNVPTSWFYAKWENLKNGEGFSILGWVVYIILLFVISLQYVSAPRSGYVGPRRGQSIGGEAL